MLVSLKNVKTSLGIEDNESDIILNSIIEAVDALIKNLVGSDIESSTHTEFYDGDETGTLVLNHYPVTAVAHLYDDVDRVFGSDTEIDSDDYVITSGAGVITLNTGEFTAGAQNIKVEYTAGYSSVPRDIKFAAIKYITAEYLEQKGEINVMVKTGAGKEGQTMNKPDYLRQRANDMLEKYRRPYA